MFLGKGFLENFLMFGVFALIYWYITIPLLFLLVLICWYLFRNKAKPPKLVFRVLLWIPIIIIALFAIVFIYLFVTNFELKM